MSDEAANPGGDDPSDEATPDEPTGDHEDGVAHHGDGAADDVDEGDIERDSGSRNDAERVAEDLAASIGGERARDDDAFDPTGVDGVARDLTRQQVERLFDVLEAALTGPDRLDEDALDTLLSSLEAAVVDPARVDSEELDRMLSLWEAVLVDATSFDDAERALAVFEAAGLDERRGGAAGLARFLDQLGLDGLLDTTGAEDAGAALSGDREAVEPYRLARLLATVTRNATTNSGETGVRVATELARAAATAHSPAELLDDGRAVALAELERLGVDTGVDVEQARVGRGNDPDEPGSLRERGEALLEQSADIDHAEEYHPAYDHVVTQLAPDEARVLRLLATEGPQPSVDVRDVGWLPLGSKLVAARCTMLAQKAGCRHAERMPAYADNLDRLGLVWFADEPVEDLDRYRVLEAQPRVENAEGRATRPKMDRGQVHLTPFGVEFCRAAFGMDPVPDAAGPLGDVEPNE